MPLSPRHKSRLGHLGRACARAGASSRRGASWGPGREESRTLGRVTLLRGRRSNSPLHRGAGGRALYLLQGLGHRGGDDGPLGAALLPLLVALLVLPVFRRRCCRRFPLLRLGHACCFPLRNSRRPWESGERPPAVAAPPRKGRDKHRPPRSPPAPRSESASARGKANQQGVALALTSVLRTRLSLVQYVQKTGSEELQLHGVIFRSTLSSPFPPPLFYRYIYTSPVRQARLRALWSKSPSQLPG